MNEDESIDWESLERYIQWILDAGPLAIAINMDASEAHGLSEQEQLDVLRFVRGLVRGRCPLFSGLIAGGTALAIELGLKLRDAGADGLVVFSPMPTFIGQPVEDEMVVRYHRQISEAVGLPLIAFQWRKGLGADYHPSLLRKMAEIPGLVGLKESSGDTQLTTSTVTFNATLPDPLPILTGSDVFIFEAMVSGCDGALIGFAATGTKQLVDMYEAVAAGDYARGKEIWDRLGPLSRFCWQPPIRKYRPRLKEVLVMQGLIKTAQVRSPLLGVDEAERVELRRLAQVAGLL